MWAGNSSELKGGDFRDQGPIEKRRRWEALAGRAQAEEEAVLENPGSKVSD